MKPITTPPNTCLPVKGEGLKNREIVFVHATGNGSFELNNLQASILEKAKMSSQEVSALPIRHEAQTDVFVPAGTKRPPMLIFRDVEHPVVCGQITGLISVRELKYVTQQVLEGKHPNVYVDAFGTHDFAKRD